ncbi:hypothetical protein AVT69_gp001 [Pseudomonas phage PhiPA3]|uniref:Uncharacterized protein 001 n=1 Tax=Pseudomonas phage PhiPA3 TaxID=998086 RepID=F8SJN2_BPPA3|nr:hypothetical protein AVT69_gp001 [Pseudomonas phage PhiPA3]AEH03427.1 hypothetical protein [Pseudomonas phage PhiPA3]
MPLYQAIQPLIEAHPWTKNGDHPMDRTVNNINEGAVVGRHPSSWDPTGDTVCKTCDRPMREHGILKIAAKDSPSVVCPGDYIETIRDPKQRIMGYRLHHKKSFESKFEKVITQKVKK